MQIRIQAAAESNIGQVRQTNEDAFGFDLDLGLFVVCDGVGGHQAGEVASRLAVDSLLDTFARQSDENIGGELLHRAIQRVNRVLHEAASSEPAYTGMSTTVVAGHFDGRRMTIVHVGDSRAYLMRDLSLHRLTEDHSLLTEHMRSGRRQMSDMEAARLESILTQALGVGQFVVPVVTSVRIEMGDCFLLATDGLTRTLSHSEIQSHLIASVSPEHACRQLINAANRAGGSDNITCMVVQID
jgi:serine/threonine protein phosphatase PrpC